MDNINLRYAVLPMLILYIREKSMHGRRCASKLIPQGKAVAQVSVKTQPTLLIFCCHSKRKICVLNRTALDSTQICTQVKALASVVFSQICCIAEALLVLSVQVTGGKAFTFMHLQTTN